jgi:hypothetical protein
MHLAFIQCREAGVMKTPQKNLEIRTLLTPGFLDRACQIQQYYCHRFSFSGRTLPVSVYIQRSGVDAAHDLWQPQVASVDLGHTGNKIRRAVAADVANRNCSELIKRTDD